MGIVMLAVMLFLSAGTVNWIAGWAMVDRHGRLGDRHGRCRDSTSSRTYWPNALGREKGAKTWDTVLLSLYGRGR